MCEPCVCAVSICMHAVYVDCREVVCVNFCGYMWACLCVCLMQSTKRGIQNVLNERWDSSHRLKTGGDTSAIPTPSLSSCFLPSWPQPSPRQTQSCVCAQGRAQAELLWWMGVIVTASQASLNFFWGAKRDTLTLCERDKDLGLIYSTSLSGMPFAGWSSGVLTSLLAPTRCQDGVQTSVCVHVRGRQTRGH